MARLERSGGPAFDLVADQLSVGRGVGNDLVLTDEPRASRLHARIERAHGAWILTDATSRNGTFVNGVRIADSTQLHHGDEVRIGATALVFTDDDDPLATLVDVAATTETAPLSDRERQIVALVAKGLTDREIAADLFLSPATVRSHLDRIRDKTGRRRRSELTQLAIELRLL